MHILVRSLPSAPPGATCAWAAWRCSAWRRRPSWRGRTASARARCRAPGSDGHVQTYSGKGNLPGHFVPRLKLALPAAAAYWVQALGGAPLLGLHRQVDGGMVRAIWQRIVPQLQQLGLLPAAPDPEAEPVLTPVFDREGWSPQLFHELRAQGVAVVTWIKGPQEERWPASEFAAATIPVRAPGGPGALEGRVARRKLELEFGPATARTVLEAREIRFRADRRLRGQGQHGQPHKPLELSGQPGKGQRQPAVLTTHPRLPAEQVAGLLRSRWTQENYFKCMRAEFGLDSLPEHALEEVEPDAWGVNPAWRTIGKALREERNAVGHLRRRRAAETDAAKAGERDARIRACDQAIAGLVRALKSTDRHLRAGADRHPAPDRLPGRDGDGGRGRPRTGQSRHRPQPAQGADSNRRQPAARPRSRHAHRAPAAPGDPCARRGAGPPAGRTEPNAHGLPRHQPAPGLRNPACWTGPATGLPTPSTTPLGGQSMQSQ